MECLFGKGHETGGPLDRPVPSLGQDDVDRLTLEQKLERGVEGVVTGDDGYFSLLIGELGSTGTSSRWASFALCIRSFLVCP